MMSWWKWRWLSWCRRLTDLERSYERQMKNAMEVEEHDAEDRREWTDRFNALRVEVEAIKVRVNRGNDVT